MDKTNTYVNKLVFMQFIKKNVKKMKKERQNKISSSLLIFLFIFIFGSIQQISLPEVNNIERGILASYPSINYEDSLPTTFDERIRTSVTLDSNYEEKTRPNDRITISGRVSPETNWLSEPVPLYCTVRHPDGTYAYNGILNTDEFGNYNLVLTVKDDGYIYVKVRFLGNNDYRPSESEMIIPIIPELGIAIIVAGGGYSSDLFPSVEYLSDLIK